MIMGVPYQPFDQRIQFVFFNAILIARAPCVAVKGNPPDVMHDPLPSWNETDEFKTGDVAFDASQFRMVGRRPIDIQAGVGFVFFATDLRSSRVARGPGRPGKGGEEEERGWAESGHGST